MATVECVLPCDCLLGEGPSWHPGEAALYWTDIPAKRIHRYHPSSGKQRTWTMPEMVTALAPRQTGGLIIASQSGIDFFDPDTGKLERAAQPERDLPKNRSNDGKCDRQGRFWYGTMQNNFTADASEIPITETTGSLYRMDADRRVRKMDGPFTISNTFAWSPDDRVFYFADTPRGIYAYDFDASSGSISNRRMFAPTGAQSQPGVPDGSTIDADGCLWNCRWDGGAIIRYAPDGRVDRIVEMPCDRVTSCAFGGDRLDTLYVTTVRQGVSPNRLAETPLAGGLFAVTTGARGIADGAFLG
jgi:sugar lactone lactonase YvrE